MTEDLGSKSFADRYLLARFRTGGVVVDLTNGNYFRLNESAALVCEALRSTSDITSVEAHVAEELRVLPSEAARIVADVKSTLDGPAIRTEIQGSYHFYPADGGYELRHGPRRVLEVRGEDADIRLPPGSLLPSESQLELYVRALAPKLLFQREVMVLHASACIAAGRLIAFAGLSGAGKTTTARAFAAVGAHLLSEDLVVLSPGTDGEVLSEAEPFLQEWSRRVSADLLASPARSVPSRALEEVLTGPKMPLARILILDRARRSGSDLVTRELPEPDALISLMTHGFLGARETSAWRRYFDASMTLLATVEVSEAAAPDGLDELEPAAARYTSRWAS